MDLEPHLPRCSKTPVESMTRDALEDELAQLTTAFDKIDRLAQDLYCARDELMKRRSDLKHRLFRTLTEHRA